MAQPPAYPTGPVVMPVSQAYAAPSQAPATNGMVNLSMTPEQAAQVQAILNAQAQANQPQGLPPIQPVQMQHAPPTGEAPKEWMNRNRPVAPMVLTNAGQQDPSSVVPYQISTQERAGQLIDKANKAGVISDQTAIDIAGEVATTAEALNPYAVANMPTDLKIGFRFKMLAILMFNIVIILGLMYIIHFHPYLQYLCNKRAPVILTSMVISMITSGVMYIVKDKYPYNHICLGVFTISFGVFMGSISTIFHGYWNFQFMIYSLMSIVVFGILICNRWSCFDKQPMGLHSAGLLSWLVVLGLSAILQFAKINGEYYAIGSMLDFTLAHILTAMTIIWFSADAAKIEKRLTPDDYMMGVICFYTDFFIIVATVLILCCTVAMFCAGGGEGPPEEV